MPFIKLPDNLLGNVSSFAYRPETMARSVHHGRPAKEQHKRPLNRFGDHSALDHQT
jgi:hypothetical protein